MQCTTNYTLLYNKNPYLTKTIEEIVEGNQHVVFVEKHKIHK
jgi:hypothetical protein